MLLASRTTLRTCSGSAGSVLRRRLHPGGPREEGYARLLGGHRLHVAHLRCPEGWDDLVPGLLAGVESPSETPRAVVPCYLLHAALGLPLRVGILALRGSRSPLCESLPQLAVVVGQGYGRVGQGGECRLRAGLVSQYRSVDRSEASGFWVLVACVNVLGLAS